MLLQHFRKNIYLGVLVLLFIILTALRVYFLSHPGNENTNALIWGSIYQIIALWGALCGFHLAKLWGGSKSLVGKASNMFAFGLLAQSFGQCVYSYYFYTGGETPYPSLGDVGFFGSVLFYIYGAILLAKISGINVTLKSYTGKVFAIVVPAALLILSYLIFLNGYEFDRSNPLKTFLDFGYPLGQAIYVSIAFLTLLLTRSSLGGVMKKPIVFFLIALIIQYFSDFMFLYMVNHEIYVPGGIIDFLYFVSYFAMALSLIKLGSAFEHIRSEA
jgi:hypothetical protein